MLSTDPVGRLLFNVLAMVAELEADLIRMRTRDGMAVAKAKGQIKGKQPKLTHQPSPAPRRNSPTSAPTARPNSQNSSASAAPPSTAHCSARVRRLPTPTGPSPATLDDDPTLHGQALAAPQIGVEAAAFVYDCVDGDFRRQVGVVCNPVVELPAGKDRNLEVWHEGCLSLPGGYAELARPNRAICRSQNQYGDPIELSGSGLLARCFQHETDHLPGMVFGDRLSGRRRRDLYESHRQVTDRYPFDWPISETDPL